MRVILNNNSYRNGQSCLSYDLVVLDSSESLLNQVDEDTLNNAFNFRNCIHEFITYSIVSLTVMLVRGHCDLILSYGQSIYVKD